MREEVAMKGEEVERKEEEGGKEGRPRPQAEEAEGGKAVEVSPASSLVEEPLHPPQGSK